MSEHHTNGMRAVSEGEAILRMTQAYWKRGLHFPTPAPEPAHVAAERLPLAEMVERILQFDQKDRDHPEARRWIAVALGLARLRECYAEFNLQGDERTWPEFVAKHLGAIGAERIAELLGKMGHRPGLARLLEQNKGGRPPTGKAMTSTERSRRLRAKHATETATITHPQLPADSPRAYEKPTGRPQTARATR